jgi:prepilin-type N-terminal cleavage/methylation domain-containing protein
MKRNSALRAGFTLIELMAVVLILAILAGVALPKFFDYQVTAREAACKGSLGGIRAGIANFYANEAVTNGTAAYPTLAELTTIGSVMQESLPDNPYGGTAANGVEPVSKANGDARDIVGGSANGWAYFSGTGGDAAIFYANTDSNPGTVDEFDF